MKTSSSLNEILNANSGDYIDQNSVGYIFGLSTWQSGTALIFLLIATISIFFIYKKWGRITSLCLAFGIGLVGLVVFGYIFAISKPGIPPEGSITWVDEVNNWLAMPSSIFLSLISFVIPLYVFTSIVLLINNQNKEAKNHAWMFSSSMILLVILPILGIAIGLAMIPLINLIPQDIIPYDPNNVIENENSSIPNIIVKILPYSLIMLTSPAFLGSVVIFAILLGIVIKTTEKNHAPRHHDIVFFFTTIKIVSDRYLGYVLMLIPLVIATRLPMLMMVENIDQLTFVSYYIGLFFLGGTIIMIILTTIIMIVSPAKKHKVDTLVNHWTNSVANPSLATMLPITKQTTRKLGASEDMSEITPTLGTSMGLVMCGGFTPTILALMTENNIADNSLTLSFVFLVIIYVFIASFGTSGVSDADSIIVLAVLGSLGLPPEVYLTIMVVSPLTELVAILINSTGQIAVTMLNDKLHSKTISNYVTHENINTNEWEIKEIHKHLNSLKANNQDKNELDKAKSKTKLNNALQKEILHEFGAK